jgi:hypothetical protein
MSLLDDLARLGASSGSIGSLQFGQKAFSTGTKAPQCLHLFISLKLTKLLYTAMIEKLHKYSQIRARTSSLICSARRRAKMMDESYNDKA